VLRRQRKGVRNKRDFRLHCGDEVGREERGWSMLRGGERKGGVSRRARKKEKTMWQTFNIYNSVCSKSEWSMEGRKWTGFGQFCSRQMCVKEEHSLSRSSKSLRRMWSPSPGAAFPQHPRSRTQREEPLLQGGPQTFALSDHSSGDPIHSGQQIWGESSHASRREAATWIVAETTRTKNRSVSHSRPSAQSPTRQIARQKAETDREKGREGERGGEGEEQEAAGDQEREEDSA
jgi:hypothetical protein